MERAARPRTVPPTIALVFVFFGGGTGVGVVAEDVVEDGAFALLVERMVGAA